MYGLLNKALESLVRAKHGDAAWDNVCKLAKLHIGTFVSMEQYPDDLTYRLIQASSEVLSIPTADLLFALGQRWIEHTGTRAELGHDLFRLTLLDAPLE